MKGALPWEQKKGELDYSNVHPEAEHVGSDTPQVRPGRGKLGPRTTIRILHTQKQDGYSCNGIQRTTPPSSAPRGWARAPCHDPKKETRPEQREGPERRTKSCPDPNQIEMSPHTPHHHTHACYRCTHVINTFSHSR